MCANPKFLANCTHLLKNLWRKTFLWTVFLKQTGAHPPGHMTNWTYIRRSEGTQSILLTSYLRSNYVLFPGGFVLWTSWKLPVSLWNESVSTKITGRKTVLNLPTFLRESSSAWKKSSEECLEPSQTSKVELLMNIVFSRYLF